MPHAYGEAFHAKVRYPKWFDQKAQREDLGMGQVDCSVADRKGKDLIRAERSPQASVG